MKNNRRSITNVLGDSLGWGATCLVLLFSGCGGGAETAKGEGGEVKTTFDVKWKNDTSVIDEQTLRSAVENPTPEDGVFRIKAQSPMLQSLQEGKVVVLSGIDVVRVKKIHPEAEVVVVETEPAAFIDAVQDAHLTWSAPQALPTMILGPADMMMQPSGGKALTLSSPEPLSAITSKDFKSEDSASWSGDIGIFSVNFKAKRSPEDVSYSVGLKGKLGIGALGAKLTGKVKRFDFSGNLDVESSSVKSFGMGAKDIDVDIEVEFGAVESGSDGAKSFGIPIEFTMPFLLGPVPAYVTWGLGIDFQQSIEQKNSILGTLHCRITGSQRFEWVDGKLQPSAHIDDIMCETKQSDEVALAKGGVGFVFEIPKLGFGIGFPKLVGAEATFKFQVENVVNITPHYEAAGPYPVVTGFCRETNYNTAAAVGGAIRLLGFSLEKETQLTFAQRKEVKAYHNAGAECMATP